MFKKVCCSCKFVFWLIDLLILLLFSLPSQFSITWSFFVFKYIGLPIIRTLYNSNLPLTRSNFNFPSERLLYNFTLDNSNFFLFPLKVRIIGSLLYYKSLKTLFQKPWVGPNWCKLSAKADMVSKLQLNKRDIYRIITRWGGGGGGIWVQFHWVYVPLASQSPYPIIVYSVTNYRPHLSDFWANM